MSQNCSRTSTHGSTSATTYCPVILSVSNLHFSGTQGWAFYFACPICLWFCNYTAHCSCKSCHFSSNQKTGLYVLLEICWQWSIQSMIFSILYIYGFEPAFIAFDFKSFVNGYNILSHIIFIMIQSNKFWVVIIR